VDSAFRGLAEWDDAGIETVDERAEGQEVQRAFWGDVQTFAHGVVFNDTMCLAVKFPVQDSRTLARCKVLFVKSLQKSFVFLQKKTGNYTRSKGKYLYNSQAFGEILRVFNVD
jgi:hypothetical protein